MLETQKPNTMHWASENDKNFIAELISGKKEQRLIWDGYLLMERRNSIGK